MTRVNFFSVLLIISAIMFLPVTAKAQVTIGGTSDPHDFSILELISNDTRGFRLPQLTERQRDAMQATAEFQAQRDSLAMGLQIFNTCNQCVETWNGERWISFCFGEPQRPPFTPPTHFDPNCAEEPDCTQLADFVATVTRLADVTNPSNHTANARPFSVGEVSFNMMPVTGGIFYMGVEAIDDASPNFDEDFLAIYGWSPEEWAEFGAFFNVHLVGLSSFYIGEFEVTRSLFRAVMTQAFPLFDLVALDAHINHWGVLAYNEPSTDGLYPMHGVSWYDVIVFMNRLSVLLDRDPVYYSAEGLDLLNPSYIPVWDSDPDVIAVWDSIRKDSSADGFRLPTESEWEYAFRGGQLNEYTRSLGASGEQFLFSDDNLDEFAWYSGNSGGRSHPVGQLRPNQLGLFDMSGNVFEWVWDWFDIYPVCCSVDSGGPDFVSDDVVIDFGSNRILRGSGWGSQAANTRVLDRNIITPTTRDNLYGFRIAFSSVE